MEKIIEVSCLKKYFKVHHRADTGVLSALSSMFKREFKTVRAVDNISFSVKQGSIHALIGPNGSGKSTTIKILSGILYPSGGNVKVMDYIPWKQRQEYVRKIGVLFGQKSQLGWELPALDTYKVNRTIYKIPLKKFNDNLESLISQLQIENIVTKPVRNLSLGERMRCEIACLLLHMPDLVFLDEPTIGLDLIAKDIFRNLIKNLNRERGTTFILTTHDLNEVENLCDSATVINLGQIVFDDRLEKLKELFQNKKIIEIAFSSPLPDAVIKKMQIEMRGPLFGRIQIDLRKTNMQTEIIRIFSQLPVCDLNIQTVNIESVIRLLYQKPWKETAALPALKHNGELLIGKGHR